MRNVEGKEDGMKKEAEGREERLRRGGGLATGDNGDGPYSDGCAIGMGRIAYTKFKV